VIVPAVGTRVREFVQRRLRRLPVLGSVYAIIAALGLVVLAVGVIGVGAVYTTNKHVRELEEVANRAFFAEHANSLIYAVVMDSRGIYMSADAADRATYGAGVMKFLAELDANMTAWQQYVAPDDRNDFARAQARAQEFIRFRTELVRLGNEVGQGAARAWGDNDANRTSREALNREIDLLAKANYAELAKLRAWINEYSIWQFMLAAATMAGGILLAILLIVLTFGRYRKEAATEVASKEAYLAEAQRLSHTGSFGWSAASGFVWSDETFRIFELDRAAAPTVAAIIQRTHPEDRERVQEFIERASRGGGDWDVEHRLLLPDGAVKSLHVVVHAVRDKAGVLSFVGAVMDVTAAKRAEEAIQAAQAELAHVARMTTLGELTAWIAHEVNQPLAGIVTNGTACLQWLGQKTPALDEARSAVEDMIGDAQRAGDVILEIRALSRKTAPKRAALDINELIQGVVRLVTREAQAHGASVRLELAPALPAVVGDRVQLQQVVINLVINAIQAMASVTARPRELSIRSRRNEAGHVLIEVADSGHGIGSSNADQLFKAFFTTKPAGMGMGLSICRSIIEAHGGNVWASDNTPSGAVFHFTLPAG
jgi:C4-dicarboxylate-specific signal transduction histidine kinase